MRFIKADAVTVGGRGFIRLARNWNMCQEKCFSQQMMYALLMKKAKKQYLETSSCRGRLLMIIYEMN